jgi:hypothetical protein
VGDPPRANVYILHCINTVCMYNGFSSLIYLFTLKRQDLTMYVGIIFVRGIALQRLLMLVTVVTWTDV